MDIGRAFILMGGMGGKRVTAQMEVVGVRKEARRCMQAPRHAQTTHSTVRSFRVWPIPNASHARRASAAFQWHITPLVVSFMNLLRCGHICEGRKICEDIEVLSYTSLCIN